MVCGSAEPGDAQLPALNPVRGRIDRADLAAVGGWLAFQPSIGHVHALLANICPAFLPVALQAALPITVARFKTTCKLYSCCRTLRNCGSIACQPGLQRQAGKYQQVNAQYTVATVAERRSGS